jgi:GNAT superfamily N-acetyltransferase
MRFHKYVRDLQTLPHDVRLLYRRGGWREVRQTLADRSVHRFFRSGHMLVIAQELSHARDVVPPPGVSIRRLSEDEWPAIATLAPQRDLDRFRRLVADGHTYLIAWRGDQPIGYTWYTRRLEPGVSILPLPLPPHAAYLWDLYVVPAERSNGVGSALVAVRLQLAREAGCREGWRIIAPTNRPSLRTVDKTATHSRIVGEIRFVKLFSRVFARYRDR